MFCPKCGLGNLADQKFCRGCGHALAGHRAALEDNFESAVERIKAGTTALGISAVGLIIMSLMSLGIWITQKDAAVFFTLIPVLAFGIPAAVLGLVRLHRAYRTLSHQDNARGKAIQQSKTVAIPLTPIASTDPLAQSSLAHPSVTENTTFDLQSPKNRRDRL
jgi:hypothetical protein